MMLIKRWWVLVIIFLLSFKPAPVLAQTQGCGYTDLDFTDFAHSTPGTGDIKPLIDMGSLTYVGFGGGLYPGGSNTRPTAHAAAGLTAAASVQLLDGSGNLSSTGKIVLMSVGMSNTSTEFGNGSLGIPFILRTDVNGLKSPNLVLINGAQGGQTAEIWADPNNSVVWPEVTRRLSAAGVTANQVQVVWVKNTERDPGNISGGVFPNWINDKLLPDLEAVAVNIKSKFPKTKIIYFSSRTRSYRMYNNDSYALNPEPYAFESGFSVKWLVEKYINGQLTGVPYITWGPYLWIDGLVPRSDGKTWRCIQGDDVNSDIRTDDYTHPGGGGITQVGDMLLNFFSTDPTACSWFLANPGSSCSAPPVTPPPSMSPSPTAVASPSIGPLPDVDINRDGVVNVQDLLLVLKAWLGTGACGTTILFDCDVQNDQKVNMFDAVWVIKYIVAPPILLNIDSPNPSRIPGPEPVVLE